MFFSVLPVEKIFSQHVAHWTTSSCPLTQDFSYLSSLSEERKNGTNCMKLMKLMKKIHFTAVRSVRSTFMVLA